MYIAKKHDTWFVYVTYLDVGCIALIENCGNIWWIPTVPYLNWLVYKALKHSQTHSASKCFCKMTISNVQNVKIAFNIVFLRDTECSFDKKIICIFMVSSPFSFQKSIPTWEICYFERKSTWNRSHRIMNCSTWTGIHFRLTFPIKIV